jgi:hypothetical protein
MSLSEFPDTLSPVVLNFGGHIGDRNICGEKFFDLSPPPLFFRLRLSLSHYFFILVKAWSW